MVVSNLEQNLKIFNQASSSSARQRVLFDLSNSLIFVPIVRVEGSEVGSDTRKVKIFTEKREEQREVSIFTTEDKFFRWAEGKNFQQLNIAAGDLALTLPKETAIIIDPGSENEVILSREEVEFLAYPTPVSEPETGIEEVETENLGYIGLDEVEQQLSVELPESEISEAEESAMMAELGELINNCIAVAEGYLVPHSSGYLLGLLGENINSEERFNLIEQVAKVSKKYLGQAGAVEVYDDLNIVTSKSWEFFQARAPFFIRAEVEEAGANLGSKISRSGLGHRRKGVSLWHKLRAKYAKRG